MELAQIEYDMPLAREAISREKRGERQAAMFGGGDYGVEAQYDMMRKRMTRIRRDLERIRGERHVRRKHRRRSGFHLVSLAGYTNAGKSSLLKAMSERHVVVEDRYFTTLATKTARARSDKREILVTDTVGFIEDLPPWMVEAFHSTLEEIALADVILLVLDASDPVEEMARRLRSSLSILRTFDVDVDRGAPGLPGEARKPRNGTSAVRPTSSASSVGPYRRGLAPILVALNKTDRVGAAAVDVKRRALEEQGLLAPGTSVALSAATGEGLDDLYDRLYDLIPDYDEYEVALPPSPSAESVIAWLHENADVLDLTRGNESHVHFEAKKSIRFDLTRRLREAGAIELREVVRAGSAAKPAPLPDEVGADPKHARQDPKHADADPEDASMDQKLAE